MQKNNLAQASGIRSIQLLILISVAIVALSFLTGGIAYAQSTNTDGPQSRAFLTGTIAIVGYTSNDTKAVGATNDYIVTAPQNEGDYSVATESPSQLASVMAALGAGDAGTWTWTLLILLAIIGGATYLYRRAIRQPTYERVRRY